MSDMSKDQVIEMEQGAVSSKDKASVVGVRPLVADRDLLSDFIQDARDQLLEAEVHLMDLKDDLDNKGALEAILRSIHSIKSGAAFLHLNEVRQVAHETESLLDFAHKGDFRLSQLLVELLFRTTDMLRTLMTNVETALATDGMLHPWHQVPTLVEALRQGLMDRLLGADEDTCQGTSGHEVKKETRVETLRIDNDKFARLHDKVDQLSALAPQVANRIQDVREKEQHPSALEHRFRAVVADLVALIREFRLMPLAKLEPLVQNVVAEAAHTGHKKVDFVLMDGGWSVDSKVLDHLKEVCIQIAQNAVDHGIESEQERRAQGKDPTGTFLITVSKDEDNLRIQLSDDGRGLNREKLRLLGEEHKIFGDHGAVPNSQVDRLIFQQGISTTDGVHGTSGRGFGLDIAKYRVEEMGGRLTVSSDPGQHTTFTIDLPVEHHGDI